MNSPYTKQELIHQDDEQFETVRRCQVDLHIFEMQGHYPLETAQQTKQVVLMGKEFKKEATQEKEYQAGSL